MSRDRASERPLLDVDRDRAIEALGRAALVRPVLYAAASAINAGADPVAVLASLAVRQAEHVAGMARLQEERLMRSVTVGVATSDPFPALLGLPGPIGRAAERFLQRVASHVCPECRGGGVADGGDCAVCGGSGIV
jgi:hypothetical protein